ncbi:hypothetical protein SLEP1_g52391 [Rubroshorea leprosula]|uniref:Uncharacterized protein n=1 Tax=Rubroshorea leprosula TaxID=152421 RepID=A0AAV5M696_9ROSI|nr:hypothetical protein SLEP1_g52391 [Rubroshorea leprosula]
MSSTQFLLYQYRIEIESDGFDNTATQQKPEKKRERATQTEERVLYKRKRTPSRPHPRTHICLLPAAEEDSHTERRERRSRSAAQPSCHPHLWFTSRKKKTQNRTNLLCELRTQDPNPIAEEPRYRPALLPDHRTPFGQLQFFIGFCCF